MESSTVEKLHADCFGIEFGPCMEDEEYAFSRVDTETGAECYGLPLQVWSNQAKLQNLRRLQQHPHVRSVEAYSLKGQVVVNGKYIVVLRNCRWRRIGKTKWYRARDIDMFLCYVEEDAIYG